MVVGIRIVSVTAMLAAGCDSVLGLHAFPDAPDAPTNLLGCVGRSALLCADFEEGTTVFVNGLASDLPVAPANVTASVEAPGVDGGHAFYVESTGPMYRLDARSMIPATQITATFELELARFDATTPPTALVVLSFDRSPSLSATWRSTTSRRRLA